MPAGGGGGKPGGVARSGNTVCCLEKVQNPRGWMFWGFFHLPFIRSVRRAAPSRRVVGRLWWAGARSCWRSAARCGRGIRSGCGCRECQTQRAEAGAVRRVQRGGEEPGGSGVCRQGAGVQESTSDCSELQAVSTPGGPWLWAQVMRRGSACLGPGPLPRHSHTHTRTHTLWVRVHTHTCTHCGHAHAHTHALWVSVCECDDLHTHTHCGCTCTHTHIHTHWVCAHTHTQWVSGCECDDLLAAPRFSFLLESTHASVALLFLSPVSS